VSESNSGFGLVEVLDRVLDKGIVVDAAVRVSVVGVELLGVDARVVVASIQTYLRHADDLAYTAMAAFPQPRPAAPPLIAVSTSEVAEPAIGSGDTQAPMAEPEA